MSITKNSTNSELIKELGEEIMDGRTRLIVKEETSNPEYTSLFFIQAHQTNDVTNKAQEMFLGWSTKRLVRAIHNSKTEIAANFKVGDIIDLDILLEETTTQQYEGQPFKVNPTTNMPILNSEGFQIYEKTTLVESGSGGTVKLDRLPVEGTSESALAITKDKLAIKADATVIQS